ncbi:MAG: potassium-transporting ATPase subunit C [Sphingobacteriia bacterium]|jgi:K+-transporting ATPase ATPase C chain|nr:MAG: potassium-transporting ATPase subunit C [Sphingobacteriia bacterium]TAG29682.1 MAG: potassium-transporting ATPase subunit C [Sphingobacteriia bacterium]TAH07570.1 MAG: potassium-transporting ATPase subunit C [Sphingobacteriia bacterium]
MKQNILPAIRLTLVCIVIFIIAYPALIWLIAQAAPAHGEGQTVVVNGKKIGYLLEGQSFTNDHYFNGRPSAAGYNAAASSGSNKGPSNPEYLQQVQDRIDSFLVHNPTVKKELIPSDLVTASGSGLDPDISLQGAMVQVDRIAKTRNINKEKLISLIEMNIEKSSLNNIQKINVLKVNIALDQLK